MKFIVESDQDPFYWNFSRDLISVLVFHFEASCSREHVASSSEQQSTDSIKICNTFSFLSYEVILYFQNIEQ